jgi:hypothetical protein
MLPPETHPHVILPLKEFLLIETCPPEMCPLKARTALRDWLEKPVTSSNQETKSLDGRRRVVKNASSHLAARVFF